MKRYAVILAIAWSGLLTGPAGFAQENGRYVAVDGEASISVSPDFATLNLAVEARHAELDRARDEVVTVTRRVIDRLRTSGIADDDLRSTDLSIRPDYRWNDDERRQELLGYVVQRSIVVRLKDLDKLGDVMEGAVDAGVNQVQPPLLGSSDERELRRRALAAATRDARANATQIAATLDATLGPVRRIIASGVSMPEPPFARAMMSEAADAGGTYSTGQIEIEARVTAEFDLVTE